MLPICQVFRTVHLAEIGRIVGRASGLLKISDLDERFETENCATVQLARELGLVV
jgi:hypothetical protein